MSQFKVEITELKTDSEHWNYARGKVAQLKLMLKNKKAELAREKQIQQNLTSEPVADNDELRRRALALAAQNRAVTL